MCELNTNMAESAVVLRCCVLDTFASVRGEGRCESEGSGSSLECSTAIRVVSRCALLSLCWSALRRGSHSIRDATRVLQSSGRRRGMRVTEGKALLTPLACDSLIRFLMMRSLARSHRTASRSWRAEAQRLCAVSSASVILDTREHDDAQSLHRGRSNERPNSRDSRTAGRAAARARTGTL